jgi:hypothetical protein
MRAFLARFRAWIALALAGTAATGAGVMALTQGTGSVDVYVGSTPTPASGFTCDATISSAANLGTSIAARSAGQTLCLSSGTYSTGLSISGFNPASTVTIRPADGATVTVNGFDVNASTSNLRFTGFSAPSNFKGIDISSAGGTTKNIRFDHNTVDGGCRTGPESCGGVGLISTRDIPSNGNIVFDHNVIDGVSPDSSSQEGSIQLVNTASCQAAAANPPTTIEHNRFEQGIGDGIQLGGDECRTVIRYNEFVNRIEPSGAQCDGYSGCPHADSIQGVSDSVGLVITGNYFKNEVNCILTADGSYESSTFSENVCVVTDGSVRALQGAGWTNGTIRHNTVVNAGGNSFDATHGGTETSGMSNTDNIFTAGMDNASQTGGGQWDTFDYNLSDCPSGNPCGSHNITTGAPTFVGGSNPSSWAGYALASGSVGENAASDGTDMGASFAVTPGPEGP